jgi:hypothetical protein
MNSSITITEVIVENQLLEKIKISEASHHQEALEVAEIWCDENNCVLVSREFEELPDEEDPSLTVFHVQISTDDYH